jgi:hypothetical protein
MNSCLKSMNYCPRLTHPTNNKILLSSQVRESQILETFKKEDGALWHSRYINMASILAMAVQPTVKAYDHNDKRTEQVFQWIDKYRKTQEIPSSETIHNLFPVVSFGSQALDEALDVFKNVLRVLNPFQAKEALLEILEDCLEGYAIFPGSQGRRDLFNWWLLEVVPAAWCSQTPQFIYTLPN